VKQLFHFWAHHLIFTLTSSVTIEIVATKRIRNQRFSLYLKEHFFNKVSRNRMWNKAHISLRKRASSALQNVWKLQINWNPLNIKQTARSNTIPTTL